MNKGGGEGKEKVHMNKEGGGGKGERRKYT